MRLRRSLCAVVALLAASSGMGIAQRGGAGRGATDTEQESRLPNGKLQRDEILKAEAEENLKDAAKLSELAEQLKEELEKNDRFVVSMSSLKKTDEIEKLAKRIRSRLRRN